MAISTSPQSVRNAPPIFVFDSPRTRSHLFFRYLSTCPHLATIYHPFLMSQGIGQESWMKDARTSLKRHQRTLNDVALINSPHTTASLAQRLEQAVIKAQNKGKRPLSNEHVCQVFKPSFLFALHRNEPVDPSIANPTLIPDSVFHNISPILIIRHPILVVNSVKRTTHDGTDVTAADEDFEMMCSQHGQRWLFDYFAARGIKAVVIDGDDVVYNTDAVTASLCSSLGLNPSSLKRTWEPWPDEERHSEDVIKRWLTSIYDSTGIMRPSSKPPTPKLEEFYARWIDQYGPEEASRLKRIAEVNMVHYDYLKA